jgi:hypothetical protein
MISKPMDLSTMAFKLDNGKYPDKSAFLDDFKLMISNAKTYNPPATPVHMEAESLDGFFDKSQSFLTTRMHIMTYTNISLYRLAEADNDFGGDGSF